MPPTGSKGGVRGSMAPCLLSQLEKTQRRVPGRNSNAKDVSITGPAPRPSSPALRGTVKRYTDEQSNQTSSVTACCEMGGRTGRRFEGTTRPRRMARSGETPAQWLTAVVVCGHDARSGARLTMPCCKAPFAKHICKVPARNEKWTADGWVGQWAGNVSPGLSVVSLWGGVRE